MRSLFLILILTYLQAEALPESQLVNTLNPFYSDGCSVSPDSLGENNWTDCCVQHDIEYWAGGTKEQRKAADLALRSCIHNRTGSALLANIYYLGVRLGGRIEVKVKFRWGYGWTHDKGYKPLTNEELTLVEQLAPKNPEDIKIEAPRKYIKAYPSETRNYCLDQVIEHATKYLGPRLIKDVDENSVYTNRDSLLNIRVEGCSGRLAYAVRDFNEPRCTAITYRDQRRKAYFQFSDQLSCAD